MAIVNRWSMNGNSNDSVGGNNGTDTNVIYGTPRIEGIQSAKYTAATTSKTVITYLNIMQYINFSVSVWIKSTGLTGSRNTIIGDTDADNDNAIWLLCNTAGSTKQHVYVRTAAGVLLVNAESVFTPYDGKWHHLVFTDANGTIAFYMDNKKDTGIVGTYVRASLGTDSSGIGFRNAPTKDYFGGWIDDLIIYNTALSQAEVTTLYRSYFTPQGLVMSANV